MSSSLLLVCYISHSIVIVLGRRNANMQRCLSSNVAWGYVLHAFRLVHCIGSIHTRRTWSAVENTCNICRLMIQRGSAVAYMIRGAYLCNIHARLHVNAHRAYWNWMTQPVCPEEINLHFAAVAQSFCCRCCLYFLRSVFIFNLLEMCGVIYGSPDAFGCAWRECVSALVVFSCVFSGEHIKYAAAVVRACERAHWRMGNWVIGELLEAIKRAVHMKFLWF